MIFWPCLDGQGLAGHGCPMGTLHSEHQPVAGPLSEQGQRLMSVLMQDPRASRLTERRLLRIVETAEKRLSSVTVVLENLYDDHNASAVVRTAEGFGLDAVSVIEQPNRFSPAKGIVRGADRWLQIHRHRGLTQCLAQLSASGFVTCAADVGEGCVALEELPVEKPIALIFGSEHDGLSKRAKALADVRFTIPMQGFTGSFNVSVSAAVALHDITRRRREHLQREGDLHESVQIDRIRSWFERSAGPMPPEHDTQTARLP